MSGTRLRIGIDAHAIGERKTGNERFMANVLPALRAACDHELVIFLGEPAASPVPRDTRTRIVSVPRLRARRLAYALPRAARRIGLDILLVQYTAPRTRCPVVTVVHDVAFAVHPEYFSRWERAWMRRAIPATMRRAARVVTVSEFSRGEIARTYGLDPDRISVACDAADPLLLDPASSPVDPPFFLAVGNLEPRKNLPVLFDAMRAIRREEPKVRERLLVAGQDRYGAGRLRAEARDLVDAGDVEFLGYVPDEKLAGLLQHATALAFPSVYEGFGLPTLEAMAAGVPALVSDIPVMREVAGDAAVRVPPHDARAWAAAMQRIAMDPGHRAEMIDRGTTRAAGFTWERSAGALLDALESAAR